MQEKLENFGKKGSEKKIGKLFTVLYCNRKCNGSKKVAKLPWWCKAQLLRPVGKSPSWELKSN